MKRQDRLLISAATLVEALIVAQRRGESQGMQTLLDRVDFEVVPVTAEQARRVAAAHARWGRGAKSAGLNFGDCFSYTVAKEDDCPLLYLAEKTGQLLPADPARRYETIQWVFFQMAFIGPMFGQVGYFHKFAGREIEDKRPLKHYVDESKRVLQVINTRLEDRAWVMGDDYTIADISMLGWVRNLIGYYGARELVEFDALRHLPAWLERGLARPAVQRGLQIPKRP